MKFQALKPWENVYVETDPNHMFNSILRVFLNTLQAIFPVKYRIMKDKNEWITQGIKNILQTQKKSVCLY